MKHRSLLAGSDPFSEHVHRFASLDCIRGLLAAIRDALRNARHVQPRTGVQDHLMVSWEGSEASQWQVGGLSSWQERERIAGRALELWPGWRLAVSATGPVSEPERTFRRMSAFSVADPPLRSAISHL